MLRKVFEQVGEHVGPRAIATPAPEATVDGFPRALAFGNVPPGRAGVQSPQDAVDQALMLFPGPTASVLMGWVREERLDAFPLPRGKFMAMLAGWPPWRNLPAGKVGSLLLYA